MDEAQAYERFLALRWPDTAGKPVCPYCGCRVAYAFKARKLFSCKACRRQFSATSGTIFSSRKLTYTELNALIEGEFANAYRASVQTGHNWKTVKANSAKIVSIGGSPAVGNGKNEGVELYVVRRPDGKTFVQCTSQEQAEREQRWLIDSGTVGPFCIETIRRRGPHERWGYCAPHRYSAPWPSAKIEEFKRRYGDGEPVSELASYFGTNFVVVSKLARRFGFIRRPDDPARHERHGGRWTHREERLINALYDQGVGVTDIPNHHPRTTSAIEFRLRETAPNFSTRSKHGRYIKRGRKTIHRLLEKTGSDDGSG